MKLRILAAFLLLSLPGVSFLSAAGAPGATAPLPTKSRLGIPLKTLATLEAEVVRAEDVGRKDLGSLYLLRVTKVDGVGLSPGQVFKFATVAGVPSLPMDVFEIHKQRTGKNVDELAEEEVRRAEKEFVGKKLTCLASEVVDPPVPNGPGKGGGASESTLLIRRVLVSEPKPH